MSRRDAEFSEYVASRSAHLRRVAYALCGDWHRADDLVQNALIKLYAAWPRVRRDGAIDAYVRTILVRTRIDQTRRSSWRRESVAPILEFMEEAQPATSERAELFDALQSLPEMQRKVVILRHWLQLTVAETAHELRVTEGTVKSHSSRGLSALRRTLDTAERI